MSTNKNALIRYRTIDTCLRNRSRRWTLDDLINACSDALYEYEGKDTLISKRTVQGDIQLMRGNKLGYEAPIIVYNKKYYTYADENYSITQLPIDKVDMDILQESMEMLRQFKDFSIFQEMQGVIQKLEDKIYRESVSESPIIHMDKNEKLKGLHYLDKLYQAILKKIVLVIGYQSFKARTKSDITVHPYLLKEYNNRWFLVGRPDGKKEVITLALDRMSSLDINLSIDYDNHDFNADSYYHNTIGVTVLQEKHILDIEFKVNRYNTPYVETKPFHHSQKTIQKNKDGSTIFSMRVHDNYELQRLLLGFGAGLEVLKPRRLRNTMKKILKEASMQYEKA